MQATFQTRLALSHDHEALFERWGALYASVQHELFAAFSRTGDLRTLDRMKTSMCTKHRITARHFNAVAASLRGKISSRQAVDKAALAEVKVDLASVRKSLQRLDPAEDTARREAATRVGRQEAPAGQAGG